MKNQSRSKMRQSQSSLYVLAVGVGSFLLTSVVACTPAPAVDDSNIIGSGYGATGLASTGTVIYLNPTSSLVNAGGQVQLSASGGVKPYVYAVISGLGTVNTSTGLFTASGTAGTSQVEVFDIQGNTAVATITITSGTSAYQSTTSSSTAIVSVSTVDGDICPTGSVSVGTTYGVNGDRSICAITGASSGGSPFVLTDIRLTSIGLHQYGAACPTGYTALGSTPDCGGSGGCYGEQTICGLKASAGASRTVSNFYVTALGQHNPTGPGCSAGYVATGSVVDCGGNLCSGYQQFCVAH